jgi:hypothetical protein
MFWRTRSVSYDVWLTQAVLAYHLQDATQLCRHALKRLSIVQYLPDLQRVAVLYRRFIMGDVADTLQLWRWDPNFASTEAGGPKVMTSLTSPGLFGGDVINTVGSSAARTH